MQNTGSPTRLNTTGLIAERLQVSPSRVGYVIATRPHIQPAAIAGRVRLFRESAVAQIRHELNAIDARRDASSDAEIAESGEGSDG